MSAQELHTELLVCLSGGAPRLPVPHVLVVGALATIFQALTAGVFICSLMLFTCL